MPTKITLDELATMVQNAILDLRKEMNQRFDEVDHRFDRIETRVTSIESDVKEIKTILISNTQQVTNLDTRVTRLEHATT
jgi:chaperonin cofactor prefoldin